MVNRFQPPFLFQYWMLTACHVFDYLTSCNANYFEGNHVWVCYLKGSYTAWLWHWWRWKTFCLLFFVNKVISCHWVRSSIESEMSGTLLHAFNVVFNSNVKFSFFLTKTCKDTNKREKVILSRHILHILQVREDLLLDPMNFRQWVCILNHV